MHLKYLSVLLLLAFSATASALQVVTTTTDLAALVQSVGGARVQVFAVAKGTQDPHQIEAKPSFMVKMRDADLVVAQGLELETAWILPLIQGARNPKINEGGRGFLELGASLHPIEVPSGNVTRAEGDVHPGGNPHFQLDPVRLGEAAVLIADRLGELDGGGRDEYAKNARALQKRLADKAVQWKARIAKTGLHEIVTYHKTLSYFFDRFGLVNKLQLEPKPGIPPTAAHLMEVSRQIKQRHLPLIWIENFYDRDAADKVKQDNPKVKIQMVPVSVGGESGIKTNEDLIERLVKMLEDAAA